MKSGLLAPGKSVGKHSTQDHEEMVVVLSGHGQMVLANGNKIDIGAEVAAYSLPGTEQNMTSSTPVPRYCGTCTSCPRQTAVQNKENTP